jgi:predicted XRE-type DNA-binding protein
MWSLDRGAETHCVSSPQAENSCELGVTQPRVSDLLRGRIDLFSTDALIDMLARLGARVRLTVKVRPAA